MHYTNTGRTKFLLITIWTVLNLIQAYFTELAHDEAYYWVYAEYLDIGYFDHPPMIALMIKVGYSLFQNELGVRLISVLFGSATILILDELTGKKNFRLLFVLYLAFTCFHIYGFIATPDSPLILFTALFFLCYENYLKKESIQNILLLGIVISALLYSKYHGILILFFVILSNPKLLLKRSFYGIVGVSILMYLPHILWQIDNNYPSYRFHVQSKNQEPYNPMDTVNYLLGILLITSPLLFLLIFKSFKNFIVKPLIKLSETETTLRRSFIYVSLGFTSFFLLTTFNSRAEANWLIPILVPLFLMFFQYALVSDQNHKWIYRLSSITVLIFVLVRVHLVYDLVPSSIKIKDEFHLNKRWAEEVEEIANGAPVVWSNSYQNAAKHYFYSKSPSHSHNNSMYRRNQFDLWPIVDSLQGKKILFVANWDSDLLETKETCKGTLRYKFIESFRTMHELKISIDDSSLEVMKSSTYNLPIVLERQSIGAEKFSEMNLENTVISVNIRKNQKHYSTQLIDSLQDKTLTDSIVLSIPIEIPREEGKYYFRVNLKTGGLPEIISDDLIRLEVFSQ